MYSAGVVCGSKGFIAGASPKVCWRVGRYLGWRIRLSAGCEGDGCRLKHGASSFGFVSTRNWLKTSSTSYAHYRVAQYSKRKYALGSSCSRRVEEDVYRELRAALDKWELRHPGVRVSILDGEDDFIADRPPHDSSGSLVWPKA